MKRTTRADRRRNVNNYAHWVYGLYSSGILVYVGVTSNPERRFGDHCMKKNFDEMRLIKGFSSRERAEQYENQCIQSFPNLINIVRLKPRRVGFHNRMPSLPKSDEQLWLAEVAEDFDFSLLTNKSIERWRNFK